MGRIDLVPLRKESIVKAEEPPQVVLEHTHARALEAGKEFLADGLVFPKRIAATGDTSVVTACEDIFHFTQRNHPVGSKQHLAFDLHSCELAYHTIKHDGMVTLGFQRLVGVMTGRGFNSSMA